MSIHEPIQRRMTVSNMHVPRTFYVEDKLYMSLTEDDQDAHDRQNHNGQFAHDIHAEEDTQTRRHNHPETEDERMKDSPAQDTQA